MQNQNMNLNEMIAKELQQKGVCFIETKLDKLGMRPTLIVIDDIYKKPSKKQLQKLALKYKGKYNMRDNNCKENHERGLQKRIANYATQHTIATMPNSPAKVHLAVKQAFYSNVLKMLKLA